jgi:hypothetical protein
VDLFDSGDSKLVFRIHFDSINSQFVYRIRLILLIANLYAMGGGSMASGGDGNRGEN